MVIAAAEQDAATPISVGSNWTAATFRIVKILKGPRLKKVRLIVSGPVIEWNFDCCKKDKLYVLFLIDGGSNEYLAVNGHFGVVEINE